MKNTLRHTFTKTRTIYYLLLILGAGNYPSTLLAQASLQQSPIGPPPFHQTTGLLSDLLDHNVSGSPNYNQAHYRPSWFTGETHQHSNSWTPIDANLEDDSQNAAAGDVEPMNISKSPLGGSCSEYLPTGSTTRKMIWMEAYNGLTTHPDNGTNFYGADGGPTVMDMYKRGYDVCCLNWYWPNNPGQPGDRALNVLVTQLPNTNMTFCVGIDQQMLTANGVPVSQWQQCIIDNLNHLNTNYFQNSMYEKRGGRPVVLFWDFTATIQQYGAQVDWTAVRRAVGGNPLFIFYQAGGFTAQETDGSFFWLNPSASDYATGGLSYVRSSLATCANYPDKIRIPSVYCGFNGTKAPWRDQTDSWINRQAGLTYVETWGAIKTWLNAGNGHGADYIVDVTWDDDREGSGKFGGQRTDVRMQASLQANILSFSMTGTESTVYAYNLWATMDGNHITQLGTVNTVSPKQFDLTRVASVPAGRYTLYVQALSWPGLQNHVAPETFQVNLPFGGHVNPFGITTGVMNYTVSGIEIYPNPTNDKLFIKLENATPAVVQIMTIEGQLIFNKQVTTELETIETSNFPKGIYLVRVVQNDAGLITKKIVIQ